MLLTVFFWQRLLKTIKYLSELCAVLYHTGSAVSSLNHQGYNTPFATVQEVGVPCEFRLHLQPERHSLLSPQLISWLCEIMQITVDGMFGMTTDEACTNLETYIAPCTWAQLSPFGTQTQTSMLYIASTGNGV